VIDSALLDVFLINNMILVGVFKHFMKFHSVGNGIIIPTDELHHFSEG
jgi:hypothetical protein